MIFTLILLSSCVLGGSASATLGYRKLMKYREKQDFERLYPSRTPLTKAMWQELKRYIVKECEGYFYADALINEVINQGYRFTCKQIYELRAIYTQKQKTGGWLGNKINADGYVNNLTKYEYALRVDAEEKIFNLIYNGDENLLLTD